MNVPYYSTEREYDMKPYENYLIISDLDGTIIPHGGRISAANKAAIATFVAGGGHFGIATGRTPEAAAGYLKDVTITAPSIFFNGSMLYDWQRHEILATRALHGPAGRDGKTDDAIWPRFAAHCLEKFPEACIEVYTAETCNIISNPENDDPRLPHEYYMYRHCPLADVSDLARSPWLKFFVCDEPSRLKMLEQEADAMGTSSVSNHFYSEANYHEFVAQGVSKGSMLAEIRKLPAYRDTKIIALGDYLNDKTLLEQADIGIASGNAHETIKSIADLTGCRAEEDLIVWLLAHFADIETI